MLGPEQLHRKPDRAVLSGRPRGEPAQPQHPRLAVELFLKSPSMRPLGPFCAPFSGRKTKQRARPGCRPSRLPLSTSRGTAPSPSRTPGGSGLTLQSQRLGRRTGQPSVGVGTPPVLHPADWAPVPGTTRSPPYFQGLEVKLCSADSAARRACSQMGCSPPARAATRMDPLVENTAAQGKELHFPIFGADTITAILLTGKRA